MALKKIESKSSLKESTKESRVSAYARIEAEAKNILDILNNGAEVFRGFRIFDKVLILPIDDTKARTSLNALEASDVDELLKMSEADRIAYGVARIIEVEEDLSLFDKSSEAYKGQDFCLAFNRGDVRFWTLNGSSLKYIDLVYSKKA